MLNIVLFEPEIPQNTGNIARTCSAAGARLHLVHPLGFVIDSAKLKRAGLDYWDTLDITHYRDTGEFLSVHAADELFFFTTKASRLYTDAAYPPDAYLIFGKETAGIDRAILARYSERCLRLPMLPGKRSLNLSNCVAVAAFEALRQGGFAGMV